MSKFVKVMQRKMHGHIGGQMPCGATIHQIFWGQSNGAMEIIVCVLCYCFMYQCMDSTEDMQWSVCFVCETNA